MLWYYGVILMPLIVGIVLVLVLVGEVLVLVLVLETSLVATPERLKFELVFEISNTRLGLN